MVNLRNFLLSLLVLFTAAGVSAAQEKEIIFAISPMASPVSTLSSYGDFIEYLSEKTGIKIFLKQRRKYSEINDLLKTGRAQFAYTWTEEKNSGLKSLQYRLLTGKQHTIHTLLLIKKVK